MHQVLEKEGVLLLDHSNVFVTLKNILTNVYMELVLFQVLCPLYCGDGKRCEVKSDPLSMMGIWSSASDSPVVALELEQWDRREEFAGLIAK